VPALTKLEVGAVYAVLTVGHLLTVPGSSESSRPGAGAYKCPAQQMTVLDHWGRLVGWAHSGQNFAHGGS